jgi:hypothetical protein
MPQKCGIFHYRMPIHSQGGMEFFTSDTWQTFYTACGAGSSTWGDTKKANLNSSNFIEPTQ